MKITFITATPSDISAFGVRILSSYLREVGHETQILFLPGGIENLRHEQEVVYQYPPYILEQITKVCRDSDLIGLSFMTLYFDRARQITKHIKEELKAPVIWGGTHATVKPEESIQYADIVCVGEGEYALAELMEKMEKGQEYHDVMNLWFSDNGKRNGLRPVIKDLDSLPFFDFSLKNHYIHHQDKDEILPMSDALLERYLPRLADMDGHLQVAYRSMSSRGCPHRCSYCASSAQSKLRRRSVDNMIDELVEVKKRFPFIKLINFFDDTFFAAPSEYFRELGKAYKERVGLPFYTQCSPNTIGRKKMDYMVDAGMIFTEMGIQTGSDSVKEMYRRKVSNEKIIDAANLIMEYRDKILTPDYHIILDNPWEKSEDVIKTLDLITQLPRPFGLCISSLTFFPGTELYERAKREGLIKNEHKEIYRKPFLQAKGTYLNYLIYLAGDCHAPRWFLRLLSRPLLVKLFYRQKHSRAFEFLHHLTAQLRLAFKGVRALFTGDFEKIMVHMRRVR